MFDEGGYHVFYYRRVRPSRLSSIRGSRRLSESPKHTYVYVYRALDMEDKRVGVERRERWRI